jgi:hypothetical protein
MATTEKQKLANQRNAQRSTGPKTQEGKAKSRANALKHGLTGSGVVQKRSEKAKIRVRLQQWREHLQPLGVLEDCLVARTAQASVRLERCVTQELADLKRRKQRAHWRWEKKQQEAVAASVDRLDTKPDEASRAIQTTSRGCQWLLLQWRGLAELLNANGGWNHDEQDLLQRLLGLDPHAPYPGDPQIAGMRQGLRAVLNDTDLDDEASSVSSDKAREAFRRQIDAEIERLDDLAEQLWRSQDGPDCQDAEDRILVDTSDRGVRLLRYETASELSLHRSLNQLVGLRKVEPDHQTLTRFQKLGKTVARIRVGANWVTWSEYEAMLAGQQAEEPPAASAANEECKPVQADEPVSQGVEDTRPVTSMEVSPRIAHPSRENEAIISASSDEATSTSDDSQCRSRSGSGVVMGAVSEVVREDVAPEERAHWQDGDGFWEQNEGTGMG